MDMKDPNNFDTFFILCFYQEKKYQTCASDAATGVLIDSDY